MGYTVCTGLSGQPHYKRIKTGKAGKMQGHVFSVKQSEIKWQNEREVFKPAYTA